MPARTPPLDRLRARIREIKEQILDLDLVVSGTLLRRTKVCGKPECRCATDPNAKHGPYYEWGRKTQDGRTSTTITPAKALRIQRALRDHRRLRALLRRWERASAHLIDAEIAASRDAPST